MGVLESMRADYAAIRQRLRYPPNARTDRPIDLRRDNTPPPPKRGVKAPDLDWLPGFILVCKALWTLDQKQGAIKADLRVATIQRVVACYFGITTAELCSQRRTKNVIRPRQIAMYLAKELTLRSLPDIGRRFGGRDHTTVLHAVRKIGKLIDVDPDLAGDVKELRELLEAQAA
jgi:hypothetical protein